MGKRLNLVGTGGNIPINNYVEGKLNFANMSFVGYVRDGSGEICGLKNMADEGHGYGFNYGREKVICPNKIAPAGKTCRGFCIFLTVYIISFCYIC